MMIEANRASKHNLNGGTLKVTDSYNSSRQETEPQAKQAAKSRPPFPQDLESINLNEASISREQDLLTKQREMAVARAASTDVPGISDPRDLQSKFSA